jgi:hypothetical protein
VCFSATADIVGGLTISVIGIDVLRNVGANRRYAALAAMPLLLALHQLDEAFVWWSLQGHVSETIGRLDLWNYLLFAFVVLPLYIPVAILLLEPRGRRRDFIKPFVALGAVVAGVLFATMVRGPVTAKLGHHFIDYSTGSRSGTAAAVLYLGYVLATCGSLLLSGITNIARFGVINLIAVAILARLNAHGFASLWCAWAAICSGAFALHLRYGRRLANAAPVHGEQNVLDTAV